MRAAWGLVAAALWATPAAAQDVCPLPVGGDDFATFSVSCLVPLIEFVDDPLDTHTSVSTADVTQTQTYEDVTFSVALMATRDRKTGVVEIGLLVQSRSPNKLGASQLNFGAPLLTFEVEPSNYRLTCPRGACVHHESFFATIGTEGVTALLAAEEDIPFRLLTKRGKVDGKIPRNVAFAFAKKGMDAGVF